MKHKEGPLSCGCLLVEAGPPSNLGCGAVLRDWRITMPCGEHKRSVPSIFSFCMTCNKVYEVREASREENGVISHGYCEPCGEDALKSIE